MKKIQAVTIWKNGESQEANLLNAYIINDNLESSCSFYYSLNASGEGTEEMPLIVGATLADGGIDMIGEDYLGWDGSNQSAYTYIAEKLNLIIVG